MLEAKDLLPLVIPYLINSIIIAIIVSELRKQLEQFQKVKNSQFYRDRVLQLLPYAISAAICYYMQTLDYKSVFVPALLSSYTFRVLKKVLNKKVEDVEIEIDKME